MTFSSSGLSYSQSYTIKISSGVKTILGLDSNQDFNAVFETGSQSTTLNVPAYKQAHMYSCMITSARSALAYRGISVSESTIIDKVGYDPTPWSGTWNEPGSTWGDPDTGIVGSLDGKADNIGWGYGSYWGPISSAISSLGRSNEVKSGMSASTLAAEIAAGDFVHRLGQLTNGKHQLFIEKQAAEKNRQRHRQQAKNNLPDELFYHCRMDLRRVTRDNGVDIVDIFPGA